jgi:pyridinium-3,5-biscarboxylic acid mononucleotide sulfurtransferase
VSASTPLENLRSHIKGLQSVLVCYSGGIDSALVLAVAHEQLGDRAIGMTAVSPSLPETERRGAIELARAIGARHELVETHELERPGYVQNDGDRCFHCKTELYATAERKRREWQLAAIVNGTNKDDLGDHRPGLVAAADARIQSPLVDLGFGKETVRSLARELGLEIWNKPASACLASRVPYGTSVSAALLARIGGFEAELQALGFKSVRVRSHDPIARLEVPLGDLARLCEPGVREVVVDAGKRHGFHYITLDLAGYRMGSHNELLPGRALRVV